MMAPRNTARRAAGFTLIEVMVACAVCALLAAIAYPSYVTYVVKGKRARAQTDLMVLGQALEQIHTQSGTYRPGGTNPTLPFTSSPNESGVSPAYNITLSAIGTDNWTLRATPTGTQASDGLIELDSTGARRWDKDNDASFATSEGHW